MNPETEQHSKDQQKLKLDNCVKKMLSGKSDLCGVLVSGYPGVGKTYFVESYLSGHSSEFPVLISRHRKQHSDIPYFGMKQAIADFIIKQYNERSHNDFVLFANAMKARFQENFPLFLEYIPEVSLMVGEDYEVSQRYKPKVQNQLFSLFKIFLTFLYEYFEQPVLFFTDDLQWVDTSGTGLLKFLLTEMPPQQLIWIAACREGAHDAYLYFQLVEQLGINKKRVETIHLEHFTESEVEAIVKSGLGGEVHADLARICYKLSGGHPSYLQLLLDSIKNSTYLWQEGDMWFGDIEAINAYYKNQGREQMLSERLRHMSEDAQTMLYMMACMGGYHYRVLIEWCGGEDSRLTGILEEAIKFDFVHKVHDWYTFSERHVGEMIYEHLSLSQRAEVHYNIAKLLFGLGLDTLTATQVVLMTTQFNHALSMVRKHGEQQTCAELNYLAGKHSRQDHALSQAQYFYKVSADLLKECPWEVVADKIYEVYMEMAQVEYQLKGYDLAEIHLDYLLEHITDLHKRARVYELKVTINNHLGRYRKAVYILQESLRELNIELPLNEKVLSRQIEKLKNRMEDIGGLNMEISTDGYINKQQAVLRLLYIGGMSLHHTSDVLMKWAALQIIIRSAIDVQSPVKAIGYVSYGRMLIIEANIDRGFEYGSKGIDINKALEDVSLRCRVFGVYAFYIQPWKRSLTESIDLLESGIAAGELAGDQIGCYILKTHKLNIHMLAGLPLSEMESLEFDESHPELEMTYYITLYQKNFIRYLQGESRVFSIAHHKPSRLAARFTIKEENFYRNHVWARYYLLFGYYELAEDAARQAHANKKLQEGSPLHPANLMTWFLAITQHWFNYRAEVRKELNEHLDHILEQYELWSAHAPQNYASPYWLLKAEYLRIHDETGPIESNYLRAIEMADANLYHQAISCEYFARYLLVKKDDEEALVYLLRAMSLYEAWGAIAKVEQLGQQYRAIIPGRELPRPGVSIEMIQHEFSGDLQVRSLVSKLMVLALRISGSTRVVVESAMDNGDLTRLGAMSLLPAPHQKQNHDVPLAMMLLAHRSQNQIVVNDLCSENHHGERGDLQTFAHLGVRSFFILPVTIRNDLSLVLYLENSFAKNWYTEELIRWVSIAANQGSVIIENARIHELTMKLNNELRVEMKEKERLTTMIEQQKDTHLHALVQAQDNERKRIAQDLHDSLGSLLSAVKLRFNSLYDNIKGNDKKTTKKVETTMDLLDGAVDELRRIAHNMLPVSLSKFGLRAALDTFVENIQVSEHLDINIQMLGMDERLNEDTEVSIYRICQELVQNVLKHANASVIRMQLIDHGDLINLIVEDNGCGMDQNQIRHGFGFHTIASKVKYLKGTFHIESSPGSGTMVLINIPK